MGKILNPLSFNVSDDDESKDNNIEDVFNALDMPSDEAVNEMFPFSPSFIGNDNKKITYKDCQAEIERINNNLNNLDDKTVVTKYNPFLTAAYFKDYTPYTINDMDSLPIAEQNRIYKEVATIIRKNHITSTNADMLYFSIKLNNPEMIDEEEDIDFDQLKAREKEFTDHLYKMHLENELRNTDASEEYIQEILKICLDQDYVTDDDTFYNAMKKDMYIKALDNIDVKYYGRDRLGKDSPAPKNFDPKKKTILVYINHVNEKTGDVQFSLSDVSMNNPIDFEDLKELAGAGKIQKWYKDWKIETHGRDFILPYKHEFIMTMKNSDPISELSKLINLRYLQFVDSDIANQNENGEAELFQSYANERFDDETESDEDLDSLIEEMELNSDDTDDLESMLNNTPIGDLLKQIEDLNPNLEYDENKNISGSELMETIIPRHLKNKNYAYIMPNQINTLGKDLMTLNSLQIPYSLCDTKAKTDKLIDEFNKTFISSTEFLKKVDLIDIYYDLDVEDLHITNENIKNVFIEKINRGIILLRFVKQNNKFFYGLFSKNPINKRWNLLIPIIGNTFIRKTKTEILFGLKCDEIALFAQGAISHYCYSTSKNTIENLGILKTFVSSENVINHEYKCGFLFFNDSKIAKDFKEKHGITTRSIPVYVKINEIQVDDESKFQEQMTNFVWYLEATNFFNTNSIKKAVPKFKDDHIVINLECDTLFYMIKL